MTGPRPRRERRAVAARRRGSRRDRAPGRDRPRGVRGRPERRSPALLSDRTRVAAFGWASNGAGTVNDVAALCALCREAGALSYVDAVHFAPHGPIDVAAVGCDFLVCSAYKFFGPHVGILFGRAELLERHRPYKVRPAPDEPPHSWETGTVNLEGIAGHRGRDRATCSRSGMDAVAAYERGLAVRLLEGPRRRSTGVTVYGTTDLDRRVPTAAFNVAGHGAGGGVGGARRARHLRLGRQLLRARADAAARPRGLRRRGAGGRGALQHAGRDRHVPGRGRGGLR